MTVRQLIKRLSTEDPSRLVIMAIDAEGNAYAPLGTAWAGAFDGRDVGLEKLTAVDEDAGYGEDDVIRGRKALILVPR